MGKPEGILAEIIERKRQRLASAKKSVPLSSLRRDAESAPPTRWFGRAIRRASPDKPVNLIAELKKASPSRGLIREDFDPASIANVYARRASAISVLTEEDYFQGSLEHIAIAKNHAPCPVLRKDFIFDPYQVYEARAAGADAILLIEMALEEPLAAELVALAREISLDVLFEVHGPRELEGALRAGADNIGINNRDLRTLKTDLAATFEVLHEVPAGYTVVSESGISTNDDVRMLAAAGVHAILVGTSLMREPDIAARIDALMGPVEGGAV